MGNLAPFLSTLDWTNYQKIEDVTLVSTLSITKVEITKLQLLVILLCNSRLQLGVNKVMKYAIYF